mgnify:CR=1 FL=1
MLHIEIINKLNRFLRDYFNVKHDLLKSVDKLNYRLEGDSDAINYRHNSPEQVRAIRLLDSFYIYIEVRFTMSYQNKFISVSVFQGEPYDLRMNQLFRAEWDDYSDEQSNHPQPHWHITRDNAHELNFNELFESNEKEIDLSLMAYEESSKNVLDIKKIHFAMSGFWHYNNEGHVHKMDDADKVVNWMRGLLEHIKFELKK